MSFQRACAFPWKVTNSLHLYIFCLYRNMRPPNSTKSAVYQWNTALLDTCHQLGEFRCSALSLVRTATDVTMTNRNTTKTMSLPYIAYNLFASIIIVCTCFPDVKCVFSLFYPKFSMENKLLNRSSQKLANMAHLCCAAEMRIRSSCSISTISLPIFSKICSLA